MSATARASETRPVTPRATAQHRAPRRPALQEVPSPRPAVAGNGMFALIVAALLVGGMVLLLVLNTTLAQGAFEIGSLTKISRTLAVDEQRLLQTVARAEAPESLQARADQLGMVPASAPVFLRLADGHVLGKPVAAKRKSAAGSAATVPTTRTSTPSTSSTRHGSAASTSGSTHAPVTATSGEARPPAPTAPPADTSDEARPDAPTSDGAVPDPSGSGATTP